MKYTMNKILLMMIISVLSIDAQNNFNNLTIYNGGFSVVKTNTEFELKKGINKLVFKDFSEQIEISSLNLKINATQLEKSFININPDINSILKKYIGMNIKLIGKDGQIDGTLLSIDNGIIIKTKDSKFAFINNLDNYNIFFDEMLLDLEKKKEFFFVVESNKTSKEYAQISYVTNGLGWHTEYVAYLDKDSKKMNLEGWVNLLNNTGIDFENTSVKFIAGEVERSYNKFEARDEIRSIAPLSSMSQLTGIEPKSFGELYSYTYPRSITLLKNELKQLPLISKKNINIQNKYNFYSNEYNNNETNLDVVVEMKNDDKNGLGIPIPAGNIKIFKQDGDTFELIGSNTINNTPKDAILRIKTGSSFDLIGKSETMEQIQISDRVFEYNREITLKNRKNEDVSIEVFAFIERGFEVLSSDEKYVRENSNQIKFTVIVNKNTVKKFNFKYRIKR